MKFFELERLNKKIVLDEKTGCWVWTGARSKTGGYAQIWFAGRSRHVSRVVMHLVKGMSLYEPLEVMHSCDNRMCCNPNHLSLGTRTDNMRDASKKGRMGNNVGYRQGYFRCGHPYELQNMYKSPGYPPMCRICHRERDKKKYWEKKGEIK